VEGYHDFEGTCSLHDQGRRKTWHAKAGGIETGGKSVQGWGYETTSSLNMGCLVHTYISFRRSTNCHTTGGHETCQKKHKTKQRI
jgi:hypothetical protein